MTQLPLIDSEPKRKSAYAYITPKEFKCQVLRETMPAKFLADDPAQCARYWAECVAVNPYFNADVECVIALYLNTRRRVIGHSLITLGTIDTCLVHPREVFKLAFLVNASALIVMHNHPSGEASPSEADIKVTRDLMRAGQLLQVQLLDHVIVGSPLVAPPGYISLRELGYFNI